MAALVENLQCGSSVVVTAPFIKEFSDEAWCDRLAATVAAHNGILRVVWVYCDPVTMLTYIRRRGAARDDYKIANWGEYVRNLDIAFKPKLSHISVDNSAGARPLQDQAKELISELAEL
jgi:hypothetical protein